jgi:general secretion pathway protein G
MSVMKLKKKAKKGKGFTLVELLVVVAILAILAAALLPKFLGYTDKAREAQTMADLSTMKSVVEIYAADVGAGKYPAVDKIVEGEGEDKTGIFLSKGINWTEADGGVVDPYGHSYVYATKKATDEEGGYDNQHYIIASPGKDGKLGNNDDIYVTDDSGQPTKGTTAEWTFEFNEGEAGYNASSSAAAPGTDE